jgi:uncharacterized SAM-binding protein YcdF (DUF218 family)
MLRTLLRALALLVLAALAGFAFLAWQVDRLGRRDDARPADVIVVLGARVERDGRPGSDLTSRIWHALDLWQAGYAAHLICTGGFKGEPLSAAAVCRRTAIEWGVPPGQVWLADGSSSTIEDAQATAQVMAAHGWRSAILVSHPLHLFRARWLFHRAGIDAVTSPTTTDTGRIFLPLRAWYATREAGAMIVTALDGWSWIPPVWISHLQRWG